MTAETQNQEQEVSTLPDDLANDPYLSDTERALMASNVPVDGTHNDDEDDEDETSADETVAQEDATTTAVQPEAAVIPAVDEPIVEETHHADVLIEASERIAAKETEAQAVIDKLTELGKQVDEGDLTQGAYDAEKAKLDRELRKIDNAIAADENLRNQIGSQIEQSTQKAQAKYEADFSVAATVFLAKEENAIFSTDETANAALQDVIQRRGAAGMDVGLTPEQTLNAARADVALRMQLPAPKVSTDVAKPKQARQSQVIPPNLGSMSAVSQNEVQGGEFAHVHKLKGAAYDAAVGEMTDEAFRRFAASRP